MSLEAAYLNLAVLVTGGAGFIGSHLVERLVQYGAQVTVLDDCSTGNEDNFAAVRNNIRFIKGSITDRTVCLRATDGVNIIFHCAAFISVPDSLANPDLCHQINSDGTHNLLEAALKNGIQRFVFSSSAALYGRQENACSETQQPAPESPYGYSKWIGELLCQQYARCFGLKTICLRYFNVYGARQNPNGAYAAVVAKFSTLMRTNEPIIIFGNGMQTRDFIPVEQVVDANLRLALLDSSAMNGQAFNIATGQSINLLELVRYLKTKKFPDYTGEIVFAPARPGDIYNSQANCEKYRLTLATI